MVIHGNLWSFEVTHAQFESFMATRCTKCWLTVTCRQLMVPGCYLWKRMAKYSNFSLYSVAHGNLRYFMAAYVT